MAIDYLRHDYSLRSESTGLLDAALNACVLAMPIVIMNDMIPASGKIHKGISILMGYCSRKLLAIHHANGRLIAKAIKTILEKSFVSRKRTLDTEAPSTFRMPISFVRCSAVNEAIPNNPNAVTTIASSAKAPDN